MRNESRKLSNAMRIPLSIPGRLARAWERGAQELLTELSDRGELRLEEMSLRFRQSELWLRAVSLRERVETSRGQLRSRWNGLQDKALEKAGIATGTQMEELAEQLRRLQWRLEGGDSKKPVNPDGSVVDADADPVVRSLG